MKINTAPPLFNFFFKSNTAPYPTTTALFQGLQHEESAAIRYLYHKSTPALSKLARYSSMTNEDVEDVIGDSIALLIQKIRDGSYVFQGHDPVSYVIEIGKNKMKNFHKRHQKVQFVALETPDLLADAAEEEWTEMWCVKAMQHLIGQMPENCQQLIRLKYLEGWPDKEIVEQQMTQYTTVDALKNKRSRCMKKLSVFFSNLAPSDI
jgi:RNA polymerase sigma factor (sigma-70 family)